MYLLKLVANTTSSVALLNLHSTMYLLKPRQLSESIVYSAYLHSTMYLLKPYEEAEEKTEEVNLHSTMYLLKQINLKTSVLIKHIFTFHYVSIKTYLSGLRAV